MKTPLIILALLMIPVLVISLFKKFRSQKNRQLAGVLGITLVFCFTGIGHFIKTVTMAKMLPMWLPAVIPIVYVSGAIELILAFLVLIPRRRRITGMMLIALLILFLPVNIYAAINKTGMGGHQWGASYLMIRIPLQFVLISWVWWFTVRIRTQNNF